MNLIVAAGPGYIKRNEKVERKAGGFSASRLLSPFFFLFPSTLATVRLSSLPLVHTTTALCPSGKGGKASHGRFLLAHSTL
jgi:hypothetical protein